MKVDEWGRWQWQCLFVDNVKSSNHSDQQSSDKKVTEVKMKTILLRKGNNLFVEGGPIDIFFCLLVGVTLDLNI